MRFLCQSRLCGTKGTSEHFVPSTKSKWLILMYYNFKQEIKQHFGPRRRSARISYERMASKATKLSSEVQAENLWEMCAKWPGKLFSEQSWLIWIGHAWRVQEFEITKKIFIESRATSYSCAIWVFKLRSQACLIRKKLYTASYHGPRSRRCDDLSTKILSVGEILLSNLFFGQNIWPQNSLPRSCQTETQSLF